jgi:uncharacterized membrane protein YeaQ/YmgE (transglycosylase-associated protein family)
MLRLIAVWTLLTVLATLALVLGFWLRGAILPMLRSGLFGLLTALGWFITLVIGPPAVALLWQRRDAGRVATIVLWISICLYYLLSLLFFRTPSTQYGYAFVCIIGSMVPVVLLISPKAKGACRT